MASIFIDGQAGTTGLQITTRLNARQDLQLIELSDAQRKDPARRQASLQAADLAILCLPDDAAREAVKLAEGQTRILDASTAYRVAPDWAYGLPELNSKTREHIRQAQYVSNPGCYPQGFILSIRPLIEAGWLPDTLPLRCHALSGYSGGGRAMIESRQSFDAETVEAQCVETYGLNLSHKHVPEMRHYSSTRHNPIFIPSVAHYYQGMLVHIPLFASELSGRTPEQVHELLSDTYSREPFIAVKPYTEQPQGFLNPTACNNSNILELHVLGNQEQTMIVARYDNLGKGAAGAAVQNMNLMLGLDETCGL